MAAKKKNTNAKKATPPQTESKNRKQQKAGGLGSLPKWAGACIIAIVTFVAFSPSLQNRFVNFDDSGYLFSDTLVTSPTPDLKGMFTTQVLGNYHPLAIFSLWADHKLYGLDRKPDAHIPEDAEGFGFHLTSLLLHCTSVILLFFVLFYLTGQNTLLAALAALLFGIHPMHVESVVWASERKDQLYVLFYFAALLSYLKYLIETKPWLLWLTGLFFLFSLLSKGQAVTLPIALLLIDFYLDRQLKGKALLEKIPFLALSLVFGVIAIIAQKKGNAISYFPLPDRILFACYGFAQYIFKVFIPVHLSGFYPYPNAVNGHYPPWLYLNAAAGVVLLIIPTILLFLQIKKGNKSNQPIIKSMLFGWLFFFLNIALLLQLLPVGLAIMADRYTYLSYTGLFLIIAALVLELKTKYKWVMPLVIFYLLFLGFTTYQRTGVWRNSKTFLKDVIAKYPEDSTAQHKLILLENFERIDSMTAPYNNAIYQQPGNPLGYFNRGIYYQQNGLVDSAIADYSRALNIKHDFMEAYEKRGICYAGEKNWNAALADFTSALNLDPSKSPAHYMNIGNIYKELGKNDSAIVMYGLAIQVNSGVPGFYMNRSGAYFNTGDYQSALKDVMKAQQLGAPVDTGYLNAINSHLK